MKMIEIDMCIRHLMTLAQSKPDLILISEEAKLFNNMVETKISGTFTWYTSTIISIKTVIDVY